MNRAVIFDMDGVLIDSFEAHLQSWIDLAAETGASYTRDDFNVSFGRTSRETIAEYWPAGFSEAQIARMDDRKELLFREIIADAFPTMAGAPELIAALKADGFALAVGSSGPPENVTLAYERLGGASTFGAVVTGMDVTRGKPDPEVFLTAASKLGIDPKRCAVVEDAKPGVEAANAAGMVSIGLVSTGRTHEQLAAADLVVDRLDELSAARIADLIDRNA